MSEEIKVNKNSKSITFINNGIAFSHFGVADEILDLITKLQNQLQQKENIMKSLKEYLIKIKETSTQQERIMAKYVLEYIEKLEEEKVNE